MSDNRAGATVLPTDPQLYFYPEYRTKHGYGHIARLVRLQQRYCPTAPFMLNSEEDYRTLQFIAGDCISRAQCMLWTEMAHRLPLLIVDIPLCDKKTVLILKQQAITVIGIDSRGSGAQYLDYIIDLLPRVDASAHNISAYSWLPLHISAPPPVPQQPAVKVASAEYIDSKQLDVGQRCLIYFNGKKRRQLIEIGYAFARRRLQLRSEQIYHVLLSTDESIRSGQNGLFVGNRLSQHLSAFSTVITLIGVTALESTLLHKSVYVINPSSYHNAVSDKLLLTRHANFMGKRVFSATYQAVSSQGFGGTANRNTYGFNAVISNIAAVHPANCPNCRETRYRYLHRSPARALVSCTRCGLQFFRYFLSDAISYQHGYFTDAYKKRYGARYSEQQQQLERLAHERLQKIHRYTTAPSAAAKPKHLLDIGCAYGAFLSVAKSYDYRIYGVELNIEAAQSTQKNYRCSVATTDFTNLDVQHAFGVSCFDVITLWYVIEHIVQLSAFMSKLWDATTVGGIVAVATPNPRSILDRTVPDYTALTSPQEHYAVLSIKSLRSLLQNAGFKVIGVWNHGVHPEYYPTISPKLATRISNILRLGTTYTMFAMRTAS